MRSSDYQVFPKNGRMMGRFKNQTASPRVSGTLLRHEAILRLRAEVVFTSADSRRTKPTVVGPADRRRKARELREIDSTDRSSGR